MYKFLLNASHKKINLLYILFNIIFYLFLTIIPILVVCENYNVFDKVSKFRLSGWVLVFGLAILIPTFKESGKLIEKMKANTNGKITLKAILVLVRSLLFPVSILLVIIEFKENAQLAAKTAYEMLSSMAIGIFINSLLLKPVGWIKDADNEVLNDDMKEYRKKHWFKKGSKNGAKRH